MSQALSGFNEAAGIHRRKPLGDARGRILIAHASMRPPEFTGGNESETLHKRMLAYKASMRPPEFTGGNSFNRFAADIATDTLQ